MTETDGAPEARAGVGPAVAALLILGMLAAPAVRWWPGPNRPGPAFLPRPDALEYVAGAQAVAQEGRYFLQVGDARVRPRYPPGYPILLALVLRAGVPPERLWMVSGAFDGLLVLVLGGGAAVAVMFAGRRLGIPLRSARSGAGLAVVMVAATVVPGDSRLTWGRLVQSDSAATVFVLAALALLLVALERRERSRPAELALGFAGLLYGLGWVTRPIEALLALPSALVLLLPQLRGPRIAWSALFWPGAGVALALLPTWVVLIRSDLDPLQWSGYRFWQPRDVFFAWRYALEGNPRLTWPQARPRSHVAFAVATLLGLKVQLELLFGHLWPTLQVAAFGLFAGLARRAGRRLASSVAAAVAASAGLLVAGHVAFFSFYFFPAARFFLAPALAIAATAATLAGVGWARGGRARLAAGLLAALTVVPAFAFAPRLVRSEADDSPALRRRVTRDVHRWLRMDATLRATRKLRFDPVEAQALGLLPRDVVERVGADWGELRMSEQVAQLGGPRLPDLVREPGREVLDRRQSAKRSR